MLYLRVLAATSRNSRIGIYVLIAFNIGTMIGCTAYMLTFCSPVAKLFHPPMPGTCHIDVNLFFAHALLSVIVDAFILIPPIPIIWRLVHSRARRIGILVVLCLGFM